MKTALGSLGLLAWASLAQAEIIYVDIDATGGYDGTSWADAYIDLQDALGIAQAGDEIWVAEGAYLPTQSLDRGASFAVPAGVSLFGGFASGETSAEERDWQQHVTTLSGDIGERWDPPSDFEAWADNSRVIVRLDGVQDVLLDGFRIHAGVDGERGAGRACS